MTILRNVYGYIYGEEEPDRYILLSNHVDAWTYGSQVWLYYKLYTIYPIQTYYIFFPDPNSGTAVNMAVSQAIMKTVNSTKWRPRRSLMFCAWDAEEYGLLGSTEFVQQKRQWLEQRAVALLNVDTAIWVAEAFNARCKIRTKVVF